VKLTLLPMLASAAVAAQPAADDEPRGETEPLQPPGETEPLLQPPGLTPTIDDCQEDPDDPRCPPVEEPDPIAVYGGYVHGSIWGHAHGRHHHCVFRGGFGHYFWTAGG
jgi:hypothetical protein